MTQTLQLEEQAVATPHDTPQLLVSWTPRWQDFRNSIGPAFARSESRLAGEAPFGLIPLRIMIPSYVLEALFIFALIIIPTKIRELQPYVVPRAQAHDVIYYSGDELPRTEDLGGAESGETGRAGGEEAHHRTQTIKIARGGSLVPRVVDAPNVKLPTSNEAVANLLAIKPDPGPPPVEGMRSNRATLSTAIVVPPPEVIRDYTRNGVKLDAVIAPPSLTQDPHTAAPNLNTTVIPPAPRLSSDHVLVAPALAPTIIAPASNAASTHRQTPSLETSVVAPADSVSTNTRRSTATLATNVIPPAPNATGREISRAPLQSVGAVVPPPVSAPERSSTGQSKLTLPAPNVIAPPPSNNISQDMRRLTAGGTLDPSKSVVAPPQQASSTWSSIVGKLFGTSDVVPPPPSVNSTNTQGAASRTSLNTNVVAPPPSVNASAAGNPRGVRNGSGATLGTNVIAPPPSAGVSGGTGNRTLANSAAPRLGMPDVVPPPPTLSGPGGGQGYNGGTSGNGGTNLAANVVPPPPSVGSGNNTGPGIGRKNIGLGAPMDVGAPTAPATNGGSGSNSGAVISSQPGSKVGVPPSTSSGALSLSPSGGDKPGVGGNGGGTGIGHGNGPGSGVSGENSGAGKSGPARGSDPNAHGGISPTPGPGGAGNATTGNPAVRGVDVEGGTSTVTLPSFGSDASSSVNPSTAGRGSPKQSQSFDVEIVASAGSGGAIEPYKTLLHGETHTNYLDTSMGTVVMEYADEAANSSRTSLTPPHQIRTDLPSGLPHARLVVTCTLDASGNLKNIRVLDPGPAQMTAKILAALRAWKLTPAMRGDQPVEVTAILGFNIDTNDRF